MESTAHDFLKNLLSVPSPSGYEQPAQNVVREYISRYADHVSTDLHGNVIAVKNAGAPLRVMFAGHCDQIGLLVSYVDDQGFLSVQTIGGWDPLVLIGQRVTVWTPTGPVHGVMARKPIHLLSDEERKQVPKMKDLWVDIGAKDKADAHSVVNIGDPIVAAKTYIDYDATNGTLSRGNLFRTQKSGERLGVDPLFQ